MTWTSATDPRELRKEDVLMKLINVLLPWIALLAGTWHAPNAYASDVAFANSCSAEVKSEINKGDGLHRRTAIVFLQRRRCNQSPKSGGLQQRNATELREVS